MTSATTITRDEFYGPLWFYPKAALHVRTCYWGYGGVAEVVNIPRMIEAVDGPEDDRRRLADKLLEIQQGDYEGVNLVPIDVIAERLLDFNVVLIPGDSFEFGPMPDLH